MLFARPRNDLVFRIGSWSGRLTGLFGLAGGGVCRAVAVTDDAVRSYRTISPLPVPRRAIGGVFSVALSLGSPRAAVSRHRALSCSDFPPDCFRRRRPPDPLNLYYIIDYQLLEKAFRCATISIWRAKCSSFGLGKVAAEMNAAAFLPLEGDLRHQQTYGQHILAFPAFRTVEHLVHHVPLPEANDFLRLVTAAALGG